MLSEFDVGNVVFVDLGRDLEGVGILNDHDRSAFKTVALFHGNLRYDTADGGRDDIVVQFVLVVFDLSGKAPGLVARLDRGKFMILVGLGQVVPAKPRKLCLCLHGRIVVCLRLLFCLVGGVDSRYIRLKFFVRSFQISLLLQIPFRLPVPVACLIEVLKRVLHLLGRIVKVVCLRGIRIEITPVVRLGFDGLDPLALGEVFL